MININPCSPFVVLLYAARDARHRCWLLLWLLVRACVSRKWLSYRGGLSHLWGCFMAYKTAFAWNECCRSHCAAIQRACLHHADLASNSRLDRDNGPRPARTQPGMDYDSTNGSAFEDSNSPHHLKVPGVALMLCTCTRIATVCMLWPRIGAAISGEPKIASKPDA